MCGLMGGVFGNLFLAVWGGFGVSYPTEGGYIWYQRGESYKMVKTARGFNYRCLLFIVEIII